MFNVITNQSLIRPTLFISGLILFSILESTFKFRKDRTIFGKLVNLSLAAFSGLSVMFVGPMITNLVAIDSRGPILRLEELVGHSVFLQTLLSFIILDLCIYWQHRLFHRIPILWKLHRVHHCDNFFDTTTALRFHVIEILLSYILKICVITIFGISVANFLFFEIVLNLSAMFNHTNIQLPQRFEKFFSLFIVSPSFHRVHHSVDRKMTNSNFGFFLSIWDYLFRSYHPYKLNEQRDMEIGLEEYKQQEELSFIKLLLLPARK